MGLLLSWLMLSLGVWITAAIVPGFEVKGTRGALLVGAVLGVLHYLIGWALFFVLGIGTLGLAWLLSFITWWIITAILLKITDALLDSLTIKGFKTAFVGALVLSLLSALRKWIAD